MSQTGCWHWCIESTDCGGQDGGWVVTVPNFSKDVGGGSPPRSWCPKCLCQIENDKKGRKKENKETKYRKK